MPHAWRTIMMRRDRGIHPLTHCAIQRARLLDHYTQIAQTSPSLYVSG